MKKSLLFALLVAGMLFGLVPVVEAQGLHPSQVLSDSDFEEETRRIQARHERQLRIEERCGNAGVEHLDDLRAYQALVMEERQKRRQVDLRNRRMEPLLERLHQQRLGEIKKEQRERDARREERLQCERQSELSAGKPAPRHR